MKRMTAVHGLLVPREIEDIAHRFIRHPTMQYKVSISASEAAGSAELAFYRGVHLGRYEAEKLIRHKFPEAAEFIRDEFSMNKQGNIQMK